MIKGKVTTRPITQEDIDLFYPEGIPYSIRGWVGEVDGTVIGLGGYWITRDSCTCVLFPRSDIEISKLTLWRGIKQVFFGHIIPSTERKLAAIQDNCESNSFNLLLKLGFIPSYKTNEGDQVFIYVGENS